MTDLLDSLIGKSSQTGDPLDDVFAAERNSRIAATLHTASPPDVVGRANVLARESGLPPSVVETNLDTFARQQEIDRNKAVMAQYPAVGRWASDPRNAAVAADDYESLGLLGKGFYGLKNIGASLKAGVYSGVTSSLWGVIAGLSETAVSNSPIAWAENKVFGNSIENVMGTFARKQQKQGQAMADAARPRVDNWFARNLLQGVESVPVSAVAVGTAAMGAPSTGVGVFAGSVGGNEYAKAREAGLSPNRAAIYGSGQAAIEYLTEKIPVSRLAGDIAAKSPLMKTLFHQLASEIPGEQVATLMQDFNEWATLHPEKTFSQFVDERPAAAAETLVATIGGTGFTTSLSVAGERTARAGAKVLHKVLQSREIMTQVDALGKVIDAATKSKTAGRDGVVFGELIRTMAEDAGSENAYIPAEAINAYMQMDGYDGSFDNYRDAVDEGLATGGDVVIPLSEAVPILAKGAWATLRDDVRLTPGGMSVREAQTFDEAMADVMAEISDKFAEQDRKIKADAEPRDRLLQSLADKLMNAGFTPNTARQQAELLTQRAATRSARLGQELTGNEYNDLVIQQVLPEGLAQAQKADALDMTIGVMRKGKTGGPNRGPSLVDFIRSKGGIEDRGGDLKAMGIGPIKGVSRKGQLKLLRDYNPGQASMLGADGQQNSNSPDELAMRAWEAGYFPEFTERPSVNDLLEALAESVAGRDRFAQADDAQTEGLRKAAEELRALLENQGIDPDKASAKEIRSAVDAYVAEQAQGVAYDQLPDTIDIDGVQRPTVNSNGQPLARTKKGVRAFWKWFGDSKVVDEQGRPLVVYHGTGSDIESFNTDGGKGKTFGTGAFFTSNPATASSYAVGSSASVSPVYLALRNPVVFDAKGKNWNSIDKSAKIDAPAENVADTNEALLAELEGREPDLSARKNLKPKKTTLGKLWPDEFQYGDETASTDDLARWSRKTGYESAIIENVKDRGPSGIYATEAALIPSALFVAFSPTQIKSVNNRGTFDPADPRILYQSFSDGPRGRIVFTGQGYGQGKTVIEMFAARDNSTFLHETGHLWLEELRFDALADSSQNDASAPDFKISEDGESASVDFTDYSGADRSITVRVVNIPGQSGSSEVVFVVQLTDTSNGEALSNDVLVGGGWSSLAENGVKIADTFGSMEEALEAGRKAAALRIAKLSAKAPSALGHSLRGDWNTVKAWFKREGIDVSDDGDIPTEAHEMWARSVERYLMEGKAPVPALRKIFENFKSWLVQVYRTVAKLNSPITDDIRAVMDRLIATDEEIAQAREEQHLEAAFTEKPATMTEGEWTDYQAITSDAKSTAHDTLLAKVMSQVKRRVTKEYQDRKAAIRAEVTEEIDARPEFKAMRQMRETPIDAQWLKDGYGEDALALFPKSVPPLYKDGGANADDIAELTGFKSGDEMVRLLFGVEARRLQLREGGDKRSVREALIAQETETRMNERYGDPFTDGSIEEEALAAVHNERQGEVLAAELRVLSRASGDRPTPYRIAKAWAARTVREGIVRDVVSRSAIERYRRAAQKAGKASVDAILAGDNAEAFRQKQAQMLNNALVSEAQKVADEVEAAQARLEKIARKKTIKSVDQDYLERAQALMEQVELRPRSQRSIDRQAQFEAWANEQQAMGHDIVVPASFAASLGTTHWTRLPVEQFLGLDAAVGQIIHLGRLKQTLLDNKEAREFDEVRAEALGQMGGMDKRPPSDLMEPSRWDGIKDRIAGADASLLKMETVFDWLDQGRSDGVFNRIVFQPIAEAQHNEQAMLREYVLKVQELTKALPKQTVKRWRDKFTDQRLLNRATGNPWVLSRDHLISIALNMGNASNRAKLTGGYGWNEQAVMDVLNESLSDAEWQYVQAIWDTIESLWPQIEAMEKRVNGIAPEKIESAPITTSAGVLRGGYYPVVYDPRQSLDAELHGQKSGDALFENNHTRAATSRGFTKERTNVERPIHLSLSVIERHLSEVIHDLTHREAVMQADKFLTDRRIVAAVDETLGPEVRRQFRPWLQHIANEWAYDRAGGAAAEKFLRAMRRNATFVGMAFRASTVFMQAAGYSDSTGIIGVKAMTHGLQVFARNPKQAIDFVLERSGEVRARMDTLDRDIREAARRHAGEKQILSAAQRFGYMGIGFMDRLVVVPTWIGAYDKALAAGKDEQAAIYEADKAVHVSQGSGAAKDLASVQRGRGTAGEAMKLMTMFYSYASGYYQRLRTLGRDVRKANASDIPNLVARSFFLVIAPALLAELLAGRGPDEDDEEGWAEWAFQKIALSVFNPIPLLRDVLPPAVAAAQDKPTFGYSFTPVAKMGDTFVNLARDAGNVIEGEETKRATRNFLEGVGYVTGLVSGQIATSAQFLVDVAYGEQDPETFGDWYSGITSGKVSD